MRIAVDAMGGDKGPAVVVAGALDAVAAHPDTLEILLVGDEARINAVLEREGADTGAIEIVHASEVIEMSEPPATAFRKKKDSSISVATKLVKDGRADALISAGNTGAVVASSLVGLGRLHGISRPAISTLWPTEKSGAVVLDVGANYDCTPKNLYQFAIMGAVYAEYQLGVKNPRVGLLNIGEERSKGNHIVREAYGILEKSDLNFVGNVEGRDVFADRADVVVCDGFVGNVVLKFSESIYRFLSHKLRERIRDGVVPKLGAMLMKGAFTAVRNQLDYAEYGGAPLLGVAGVTIISHGKSSRRAIKNAILAGRRSVELDINRRIEERLLRDKGSVSDVANVS